MLDHIGVAVSNYSKSKQFYSAAGGRDIPGPACVRSTTRPTMARSCSIPTGTTWKPSAKRPRE